jgi:hypothetical protein
MKTVHLGFGFHVNCYHSYRGDTNDKAGFGNDIRIMRDIVAVLDKYNKLGYKVKGTWDSENVYSLEKILPQYAPDLIRSWQRRVKENGDEQILMAYNNGAMTALTEDEFSASLQRAVSNKAGSGLKDLFGKCEMVIRPQEVMFSPSDVSHYLANGVKAVCLYYSTNPFDAFRTIVKPLTDEERFNPLKYTYQGQSLTILPIYSQLDLMDTGSLSYLVYKLHQEQEEGTIGHDVFIFLNIDADSLLWEKLPVPKFLQKKPNFGGLEGLIEEVKDLPFVVFDTPGNYLESHETVGEVFFGEDVADGNFTGYSSWAEKPFNRLIFARAEKARSYSRLSPSDASSPSFDDRVKLLSTAHFGLASPVLNITREQKAKELSSEALKKEISALKKTKELTVKKVTKGLLTSVQLSFEKGLFKINDNLEVISEQMADYVLVPLAYGEDESILEAFFLGKLKEECREYTLKIILGQRVAHPKAPKTNNIDKIVHEECMEPLHISLAPNTCLDIYSFLTYQGVSYPFDMLDEDDTKIFGSGECTTVSGYNALPNAIKNGVFRFVFVKPSFCSALLWFSSVDYPYTREREQISSSASNLNRYTDNKWEEAVPYEIKVDISGDALITKRNFRGEYSSFPLSDLSLVCHENVNLASFNQALTGGLLKVEDGDKSFFLGHMRTFSGSMAHCPMRLADEDGKKTFFLNPFGTYFGKQRKYPSAYNGAVMDIYTYLAPQSASLAPSYNGAEEKSLQFLAPGNADLAELESLADGDVVLPSSGPLKPDLSDQVRFSQDSYKVKVKAKKKSPYRGKLLAIAGLACRYASSSRHFRKELKKIKKDIKG